MLFKDRIDAAEQLSENIRVTRPKDTIVLALPRGGVPMGLVLAKQHSLPFDVVLAKKLVHPSYSEVAIGAMAEEGTPILNPQITVEQNWIDQEIERVQNENERRRKLYDEIAEKQDLTGKDVIIVDDGIATGMTMFAAIAAVKAKQVKQITVAVPIIPQETFQALKQQVDRVAFVEVPEYFLGAVGAYYQHFQQISDQEIQAMLKDSDLM